MLEILRQSVKKPPKFPNRSPDTLTDVAHCIVASMYLTVAWHLLASPTLASYRVGIRPVYQLFYCALAPRQDCSQIAYL